MPAASGVRDHRAAAGRLRHRAWMWVVWSPVGLIAAMVLGEALLALQGYEVGAEQPPPWGPAMVAGVPAMVVGAVPGVLALWFGLAARSRGDPRGVLPAAAGAVIAAGFVALNVMAAIAGR